MFFTWNKLVSSLLCSSCHLCITCRAAAAGWCGNYFDLSCYPAGRGWLSWWRLEEQDEDLRRGRGTREGGPGIWGHCGGWRAMENCGSDWWWWMLSFSIAGPVAQTAGFSAPKHVPLSEGKMITVIQPPSLGLRSLRASWRQVYGKTKYIDIRSQLSQLIKTHSLNIYPSYLVLMRCPSDAGPSFCRGCW